MVPAQMHVFQSHKAANFQQRIVLTSDIFHYLRNALKGHDNLASDTPNTVLTTSPMAAGHKSSSHLRPKRAKALGVDINHLTEQDILFINYLTFRDIQKLGTKCGVLFPASTLEVAASKLKTMECERCKVSFMEVTAEAA